MALVRVRRGEEMREMLEETPGREWLNALWYVRLVARGKRERTRANEDMVEMRLMRNEKCLKERSESQ